MKIDRLFSIVNILVNKKQVTAKELADKFQVSIRTIYRDIEILSENGVPVFCIQGKGGGISLLDGYSIDKTILSDDEQKQVLGALQSVRATGKVDVSESLTKLHNVFRKNEIDWIQIDFEPWSQNESDRIIFEKIKESIFKNLKISFYYFNVKGEETKRIVEPYKLVFKYNCWYLYAYCLKKQDFRFFKLTRITKLCVLNDKFNSKKITIDKNSYDQNINMTDVTLKLNKKIGFRVYDEFRNGTIEDKGEYFLVKTSMPNTEWIYDYFMSFGDNLEIIKPSYIRATFINKLNHISNIYK